jgi:serine/threonine protein kinase/tetratricopeptide (TPR) repeat protein
LSGDPREKPEPTTRTPLSEAPEGAAPELTLDLTPVEEAEVLGQRVGAYELLAELGRGGMGSVWLARRADDQYQKNVAVKLIKGAFDSHLILERFRAERQILAGLDHPNIARLLDGGTTADGRPYFVMEHVDGAPIASYCDGRMLSTTERLELFRGVCAAVHYAHQRLIIHRDIKPANILVTRDGVPKLLDFGIAKLTTVDASDPMAATALAERPMTPAYASPEQIRGEAMTTSSDTYSLGVLLYELLTGHWPYEIEVRNLLEIQRAVCEQEPLRPSTVVTRPVKSFAPDGTSSGTTDAAAVSGRREGQPEKLRRRLSGDLDNIVLKAMSKEPERRYASVEQLSEDIRRHLEGLPVLARKPTLRYRATKFASRNKVLVAAGALTAAALVCGVAGVAWQARVARFERGRAERRFNDVRALANSFMFDIHDAIRDLPGATPARALLVKRALEYLDSLAEEASGDATLQRELAAAYLRLGDVQGKPYEPNLGDTAGALRSYRKSAAIGEALLAGGHREARPDLARAHERVADALAVGGDMGGAVVAQREELRLLDSLQAERPGDSGVARDLAVARGRLADRLAETGDVAAALENRRKVLGLLKELSDAAPDDLDLLERLGVAYRKLGNNLGNPSFTNVGDAKGALENLREAGRIFDRLAAVDPQNATRRRLVAVTLSNLSDVLLAEGDRQQSLEHQRRSLAAFEDLARADPENAQARADLAISHAKIGELRALAKNMPGAEESYRLSLGIHEALSRADPKSAAEQEQVAVMASKLGEVLTAQGDLAGGLRQQLRAERIADTLAAADPEDQAIRLTLAGALTAVGQARAAVAGAPGAARAEDWREAIASYRRALEILQDLRGKGALTGSDAGEVERVAGLLREAEHGLEAHAPATR